MMKYLKPKEARILARLYSKDCWTCFIHAKTFREKGVIRLDWFVMHYNLVHRK